jgi:lipid A 4'-phosphatase
MSRLGLCLTLSVGLAVGILFAVDPSLDLKVARFVHALNSAKALDWAEPAIRAIREFNIYLMIGLVGVCTTGLVLQVRNRYAALPPVRACALVLLAIAIGPGLIVNAVLKENWSRPRPGVVLASGDEGTFRAWWDPTGHCRRNCSFASGEASAAFATIAVAVVAPLAIRYTAITLALLYGLLVSAIRVTAGGHFVSDVIFAGVISALIVWVLHGLIYRWPATRVSEEEMRAWLEAAPGFVWGRVLSFARTIVRVGSRLAPRRRPDPNHSAAEAPAQVRAAS